MKQNQYIWIAVPILAIGAFLLFAARFIFGGPEDGWICVNGEAIRHGSPSAQISKPDCPE